MGVIAALISVLAQVLYVVASRFLPVASWVIPRRLPKECGNDQRTVQ